MREEEDMHKLYCVSCIGIKKKQLSANDRNISFLIDSFFVW